MTLTDENKNPEVPSLPPFLGDLEIFKPKLLTERAVLLLRGFVNANVE